MSRQMFCRPCLKLHGINLTDTIDRTRQCIDARVSYAVSKQPDYAEEKSNKIQRQGDGSVVKSIRILPSLLVSRLNAT